MKTCVERIPTELWISIFSYLEVHDFFHAFNNLNNHFDYLLKSNHLQFNVIFKRIDKKYRRRPNIVVSDDSILNRTINLSLGWKNHGKEFCQFLRYNIDAFTHLQSLSIIKLPEEEMPFISIFLKKLKFLRHLCLRCVPNQKLLEAILAVSSLIVCELDFMSSKELIRYSPSENSKIKRLQIKLGDCRFAPIIHQLIAHMPKLKSLEVSIYNDGYIGLYTINIKQLFVVNDLEILKLTLNFYPSTKDYFKRLISIMPHARRFCFTMKICKKYKLRPTTDCLIYGLLKSLINDLWIVSEKIQQLMVIIQYYPVFGATVNNDLITFVSTCQTLSAIVEAETGAYFQIQNIETNAKMHKLEMTIFKH